jgi:hypothetical protein
MVPAAVTSTFTGSASCSGRSCHGGLEPRREQEVGQDEYSSWLTRDPHARAFQVLFEERSERMMRNLQGAKKAHESEQCLACHRTPLALVTPAELAGQESAFGVGCESCHGAARGWLGLHTTPLWRKLTPEEKRKHGMASVRDIEEVGQTCVGCHVGALPDMDKGLPLRDVNHDLIAAGHPRLNFELDVYLENLPPHWNQDAKKRRDGADIHARVWAHGQAASAEAALELLAFRALEKNGRPWPEFAEYDCFACHHDLHAESWRQLPGYGGGRQRGALPWGTWHFSTIRIIADERLQKQLNDLEVLLEAGVPAREQAAQQASALANSMRDLHAQIDKTIDRRLVQAWLAKLGNDERLSKRASRDTAMQLSLATHSLNEFVGDKALLAATDELTRNLAFTQQFAPNLIDRVRARLRQIGE